MYGLASKVVCLLVMTVQPPLLVKIFLRHYNVLLKGSPTKMNLTCMSRSYQDKSIGISYSVIVAFVYENERCFCDVQRPRACSALPCRLSSAHCKRINAFTDDCYGYIGNDECECDDIMKICLPAVSGSSLK